MSGVPQLERFRSGPRPDSGASDCHETKRVPSAEGFENFIDQFLGSKSDSSSKRPAPARIPQGLPRTLPASSAETQKSDGCDAESNAATPEEAASVRDSKRNQRATQRPDSDVVPELISNPQLPLPANQISISCSASLAKHVPAEAEAKSFSAAVVTDELTTAPNPAIAGEPSGEDFHAKGESSRSSMALEAKTFRAPEIFPSLRATQENTLSLPLAELPETATKSAMMAASETASRARLELSGISAAKLSDNMKTAEKLNKFASPSEQILPLPIATGLNSEPALAVVAGPGDLASHHQTQSDEHEISSLPLSIHQQAFQDVRGTGEAELKTRDTTPTVELLQEITRQVAELRQFNAQSMALVLKPDPRTEIFVHLKLQEGEVNVYARFERGDFQTLSAHWGEIQHSLAQQGIRLGPLQESLHFGYRQSFEGHPDSSRHSGEFERSPHREKKSFGAQPAAPAPTAAAQETTRTRAKLNPRQNAPWESWA
jgi:hypothetical protein